MTRQIAYHPDDCREGLREAAERRTEAVRAAQEARIDLADWCVRAKGVLPVTEIAETIGTSRETVYQLIAPWR